MTTPTEFDAAVITAPHAASDLSANQLDHVDWKLAQPAVLDRYWSGAPAPSGRQAEARILWSEKALHLRFVCHQTEPLVISSNPQTAKKTIGLWDRDVCEIFIAPDASVVERYFEFEAAPTGEWLDVAIHWAPAKRESDWKFNSHMNTAAKVEDSLVTIGMHIPWNHWIHKPQKNERWRVNLFRCVGKDPGRGYLAWQPTHTPEPDFHVPQVFGWLIFK
jgi:hypothetical protein